MEKELKSNNFGSSTLYTRLAELPTCMYLVMRFATVEKVVFPVGVAVPPVLASRIGITNMSGTVSSNQCCGAGAGDGGAEIILRNWSRNRSHN